MFFNWIVLFLSALVLGDGRGDRDHPDRIPTYIVDRNIFSPAFGVPYGSSLPGFPVYNQDFTTCYYNCEGMGPQCAAFSFLAADQLASQPSRCDLKPFGVTWGNDGICTAQSGANRCYGYQRRPLPEINVNTGIVDRSQFIQKYGQTKAIGGTLPGYPIYGQQFENCYYACVNAGVGCDALQWYTGDPNNPSDQSVCWIKPPGQQWIQENSCMAPNGANRCYSFERVK